ncbi:1-acyl-sn-glycerol-3-phosphate acyltransferase [Campylobacter concisus]|uniref:1-acyl-sn-glycerol-3-phosphate acyltransferase n=1 Tax=Campylobacter concisus TaxID=199 RepID=A0A7S9R6T5_9BACT|nr:lysophospholipid acyltransferase family protein [Campylobacter concisus]MBE9828864.1 1-acyl-sn-glycerol-3-phosphate acyltransferase [Campylobacter concisus]QPH84509.1 1-acyl-sn-glycerol-3-phosphate acyltransferase [Campylobacter concisus]
MSKIRALFFAIEFVISVVLVVFFMWLFNDKNRAIRKFWGRSQRFFGGYKLEVIGNFSDEANILLINHQSMLDIIVIEELHPKNVCWIAKAQIGKIPIIGKILSLPKMIAVERENKHSLIKLLSEAKDRVENGRVLAIFPEGTRSQTNKLLPFKGGAKMLVEKLNLKVQPIVIVGSDAMKVKEFSFKKADIKLFCLDLVDTSKDNWLEATRESMQKVLDKNRK